MLWIMLKERPAAVSKQPSGEQKPTQLNRRGSNPLVPSGQSDFPLQPATIQRPFILLAPFGLLLTLIVANSVLVELGSTEPFLVAVMHRLRHGWIHGHSSESPQGQKAFSPNAFGLALFRHLAKTDEDVFISPISIGAALGMALLGSTKGGSVEKELEQVLHTDAEGISRILRDSGAKNDDSMNGIDISIASSAWISGGAKSAYVKAVRKQFNSDAFQIPASPQPINEWVKGATKGMIPQIVEGVDPLTVAILVNAVHFKGSWSTQFDPELTEDYEFRTPGGPTPVRMMMRHKIRVPFADLPLKKSRGRIRLAEIPYGRDGSYTAVFILPVGGAKVKQVVDETEDWNTWTAALQTARLGKLGVPKFKIDYGSRSMKGALEKLGLSSAWQPGKTPTGSFDRLSDSADVYLSDVIHKASVEVVEEGTTAAAASASILMTRSMPVDEPPDFILSGPFIFAVRKRDSGVVLFVGRVDTPLFG